MAGPGGEDPDEARVAKLEQLAFGSTYPEHEVVDRVDHLEKEIFGDKSDGDLSTRIQKLESKLGGRGAFGGNKKSESLPARSDKTAKADLPPGDNESSNTGDAVTTTATALSSETATAGALNETSTSKVTDDTVAGGDTAVGAEPAVSNDVTDDTAGGDKSASKIANATPPKKEGTPSKKSVSQGSSSPIKYSYDRSASDYAVKIQHFSDDCVARWTNFPVKVRLPDDTPPDWRKQLDSGMDKWGRYIPMRLADGKESADIEVSWVNHLVPRVLGVTRLSVNGGRMRVQVFMLRPNYYQPTVPARSLTTAFLHELGHALGLFGHSDKNTDIMYTCEVLPGGKGKLTQEKGGVISAADLNTLKQIYDEKPLPENFSLPSPMEWGWFTDAG